MPRIVPLDFVRGMAILGILLLNITAFGLPKAAYLNPAWQGLPSASDFWVWASMDLLAQAKFLTLFAILFGAGLQLLLPRGKRWIQSRLSWLVIFGLLHALLLWEGDILMGGIMGKSDTLGASSIYDDDNDDEPWKESRIMTRNVDRATILTGCL